MKVATVLIFYSSGNSSIFEDLIPLIGIEPFGLDVDMLLGTLAERNLASRSFCSSFYDKFATTKTMTGGVWGC